MNVRIGLAQHRIGPDMEENLRQAQRAVLACAGQGAQLVLLPEMFCCLYQLERLRACAQPRGGEIWKHLRALACQAGVYLLGGSMPELDAQGRIYNTSFFFSPAGEELACYRKCHLFDVSLPGGLCIQESSVFTPGEQLRVVESPFGKIGLAHEHAVTSKLFCLVDREDRIEGHKIRSPSLFLDMRDTPGARNAQHGRHERYFHAFFQ